MRPANINVNFGRTLTKNDQPKSLCRHNLDIVIFTYNKNLQLDLILLFLKSYSSNQILVYFMHPVSVQEWSKFAFSPDQYWKEHNFETPFIIIELHLNFGIIGAKTKISFVGHQEESLELIWVMGWERELYSMINLLCLFCQKGYWNSIKIGSLCIIYDFHMELISVVLLSWKLRKIVREWRDPRKRRKTIL